MKKSSADEKIYNIGVIMGNVYTAHPKELLHGIYDAAAKLPVNLQMFLGTQSNTFYRTMSNVASQENYDRQFNSVYDFALFGGLDALIIAYGTLCVFLNDDFFALTCPFIVFTGRSAEEERSCVFGAFRALEGRQTCLWMTLR